MKIVRNSLAAASFIAILTACSGGEADNQQAAVPSEQAPADNMAAMANDPNNPYAQAEMQMHERMMAAQGANASETWVRKMIEHHRGAIEMSNVLLNQGGEQAVLDKARKTSDEQGKEIQELEKMLQAGSIGAGTTGEANPFTQSEQMMHDRMMAATGENPSDTWIRKMIEHHRGAVDMSNTLIRQGGDPKVLEMARMTVQKQEKEIQELESMLGDSPASASAPTTKGSSAGPAAKVEPREEKPAPKAKAEAPAAAPKATPKTAPKNEPKAADPHAGHDMNNMSH